MPSSNSIAQTSTNPAPPRSRHRVGRAVGHAQADRLRAALRKAHRPFDRTEVLMLGYAGGLSTGVIALVIQYFLGVA